MRPGNFTLTLQKGATTRLTVTPRNSDGTAWDLSGKTVSFKAFDRSDAVVFALDGTLSANGQASIISDVVHLHVTPDGSMAVSAAEGPVLYQVDIVGADVDRILLGEIELARGVA